MNWTIKRSTFGLVLALFLIAILIAASLPSWAAVPKDSRGRPLYVEGQIIVTLKPGVGTDGLNELLAQVGARLIKPLPVPDTYLIQLVTTRGESPDTDKAVTRAASSSLVQSATPNYYAYLFDEPPPRPITRARPTDPRWGEQWDMRMISMEQAWDITKGSPSVIVAVLDTGISLTHPEFQGRLVQGRDTADDDDDVSHPRNWPPAEQDGAGHGTHVAGTIAAQGGNDQGIAGVCWEGVKIMPVKVFPDDSPGAPIDAIIEGLDYAKNHGASVVNMSLGGGMGSPAWQAKIAELNALGITIVAAAGNESGPVSYPARYPECVAVSAVGRNESLAYYSNFGPEIDIAAPGGAQSYPDDPNGVLSAMWFLQTGDGYAYLQGTSMAAPHVAGGAAILLSAGVPRSQIKSRLYAGARIPKVSKPDKNLYGAGILDVYNSLLSGGSVISIIEPASGSVVDTAAPKFKISYTKVLTDHMWVYLDYRDANVDGVPDDPDRDFVIGPDNINQFLATSTPGFLEFSLPLPGFEALEPGAHRLYVKANRDDGSTVPVTAWAVFFYTPHQMPAGLSLASIPYPVAPNTTPDELFNLGSGDRLLRLDPGYPPGGYAQWNPQLSFEDSPNKYAWPTDKSQGQGGETLYTLKRGTAFWLSLQDNRPALVSAQPDLTDCRIRLVGPVSGDTSGRKGWNMIGNPFPFKVDWANVKLSYQGRILSVVEAAAAGWIRPTIFRYSSQGGYSFQTAPQGLLMPWEGHWVYAEVGDPPQPQGVDPDSSADQSDPSRRLYMIIPPLESKSSREATVSRARGGEAEWSIRLSARCAGASDANNLAGVSSRAADGYGVEDIPEPPPAPAPVSLAFVHRDWGDRSGGYQADIKNAAGSSKSWEFEVNALLPNQDVVISWPEISSVPKSIALTLEDLSTGTRIYMRTRSSYKYNSGSGGVRRFKLIAEPETKGRLMITNVAVTKNRAGGVAISYSVSRDASVQIRIRNAAGRHIRTLGSGTTRAAGISTLAWDGRSEDGQSVPTGAYLCEIIAVGADGEVAKTVRPVLLK